MTVSTTANRIGYTGDGVSTVFTFPYLFLSNSDLKVYVDGVLLVSGVSVAGAGSASGGSVTITPAPAAAAKIQILRVPDFLQSTDLVANDPFPAESVERMADKPFLGLQYVYDLVTRAVRLPDGEEAVDGIMTLPLKTSRASKLLGFDSGGNLSIVTPNDQSASALALALAGPTGATQVGFDNRTVDFIIRRRVYADKFAGVDPSGASSSNAGLVLAVAELQGMGGGELIFSAGDYKVLDWNPGSNIDVRGQGEGATRLIKNGGGVSTYAIKWDGTVGATSALAANVAAGVHQVQVADASAWSVGGYALIRENTYVSGAAGRKQQILYVTAVNTGTDIVTFAQPLFEAYTTAAGAALCVLNPIRDVGLYDLYVEGSNSFPNGGALHWLYPINLNAEKVSARYFSDDGAFTLQTALDCKLHDVKARDGLNMGAGGYGYGAALDESCVGVDIGFSTFTNTREVTITNRARHCKIHHSKAIGNYDSGFNTHGAFVAFCEITDNDVIGTLNGAGIAVGFGAHTAGDTDITIARNKIFYSASHGVAINAPIGLENLRIDVTDNKVYAPGASVASSAGYLYQRTNYLTSSDNEVDGVSVNVSKGFHAINCTHLKSSDDTARNLPNGYGLLYDTLIDSDVNDFKAHDCSSDNINGSGTNVRTFINGKCMDSIDETIGSGASSSGRMQRGVETVVFAAVATVTKAVTFPAAYPASTVPKVVVTPENSLGAFRATYDSITNTGFNLTLTDTGGTNRTGNAHATWIAME